MEDFMKKEIDELEEAVQKIKDEQPQMAKGNKAARKRARLHLKTVVFLGRQLRKMTLEGPPQSE